MRKVISIILMAITLISCEKDDIKGPVLGYASGDFKVIEAFSASSDNVDFKSDKSIEFSAKFNEEVEYTITIIGAESGAVKTISGVSKDMLVTWDGGAELVFFRKETVTATLTILGVEEAIDSKVIEIKEVYVPEGIQIANFELGGTRAGCWFPGENSLACDISYEAELALEGDYAHLVKGISLDKPGDQFVGLASIDPRSGINRTGRYFTTPTMDPDELYFNIFIYGIGDDNVAMFIKFMQDDDGNFSHESDRENGFEMQLSDLSHKGWKLFSFPYSSVPLGGNTSFGGNGDGIHRPDKIQKIELGLWAMKNTSDSVQFIYDYAAFTAGKPFGK